MCTLSSLANAGIWYPCTVLLILLTWAEASGALQIHRSIVCSRNTSASKQPPLLAPILELRECVDALPTVPIALSVCPIVLLAVSRFRTSIASGFRPQPHVRQFLSTYALAYLHVSTSCTRL